MAGDVYITEISLSLSSVLFSVSASSFSSFSLFSTFNLVQSLVQSFVIYLHDEALASFWRCPDWVGSGS